MDFGKIITMIVALLGSTGTLSDIIKLVLQLVSKISELKRETVPVMDVAWAQRSLAKLGFDPGAIDGAMGQKTAAAIAAYQKARGLVVDGWLGAETQTKLRMEAGE